MKIETLLHNDMYMISDSIMVCANVKKKKILQCIYKK